LAYKLFKEPTLLNARKVMFASFFYLPIVQIAYVIDKL
jgi:heme O synthase-like polyprenyltransferase